MPLFTCTSDSSWVSRRGGTRLWNKAFGEATLEACKLWHSEFLPRHFTMDAYGRYQNPESFADYPRPGGTSNFSGYMTRDESYTRWKKKRWKHTNPLRFSGKAQMDTQASPHFSWKKSQENKSIEATVTFGVGNADRGVPGNELGVRYTSSRITSDQIREEFTAVSRDEVDAMAEAVDKKLAAEIDKVMI